MADKKTEKKKVRTLPFKTWAKETGRQATALGAAVAFDIDQDKAITEAEFTSLLDKYGNQKSSN